MISQRRPVLAIVIGLLLTVAVALGIVVVIAVPNLRQGSRILTPDGERVVERAKKQAKQKPLAAAGSTWHGLIALNRVLARVGRRIGRAWAPISAVLHEAMDRLESRDAATAPAAEGAADADPDARLGDRHGQNGQGRAGTPVRHAVRGSSAPAPPAEVTLVPPEPDRAEHEQAQHGRAEQDRAQHDRAETDPAGAVGVPDPFDLATVTSRSSVGRPRSVPPISGPIPEISRPFPEIAGDRVIDLREVERADADQEAGSARHAR
jgi:hypothetical protein